VTIFPRVFPAAKSFEADVANGRPHALARRHVAVKIAQTLLEAPFLDEDTPPLALCRWYRGVKHVRDNTRKIIRVLSGENGKPFDLEVHEFDYFLSARGPVSWTDTIADYYSAACW
jgi:hypothetical protein